jgi:hypothetical protein
VLASALAEHCYKEGAGTMEDPDETTNKSPLADHTGAIQHPSAHHTDTSSGGDELTSEHPSVHYTHRKAVRSAQQNARDKLENLASRIQGLGDELHSTANPWGTTQQRVAWFIQTLVGAILDLVFGMVLFLLDLFMWSWEIGVLLLCGLLLIAVRDLFLALCPVMLSNYKFATDIINAILVFMEIGVDVAITALDAVLGVVNTLIQIANDISKLSGHGKLTGFQFKLIHWIPIETVSYAEVKEALSTLPPTCVHFNTSGKVLLWFVQYGLSDYVCPVVRFVYPDPGVYALANGLLGFMIRGSARPELFAPGDNCAEGRDSNRYDYACAGMGIGYVLLDVFLAIVLLYLVLRDLWPSISKSLQLGFYIVVIGIEDVYEIIVVTLTILFF